MTLEGARRQLRAACARAVAALAAAGFSGGQVAVTVGVHRSVIAKLTADGDLTGWRPPSLRTCELVDDLCERKLGRSFELAGLRTAYDRAGGGVQGRARVDADALDGYLRQLTDVLTRAPLWTPFATLGEGFQDRLVQASDQLRAPTPDAGWQAVPRGEVPWSAALIEASVVVVLGDAGYGKTWQSRNHAAELASRAITDDDAPVPLWMHAADLGEAWGRAPESEALASAALRVLGREGVDTSIAHAALTRHLDSERGTVVIVDAYDEVMAATPRAITGAALARLAAGAGAGRGRQLLVTSRAAGYDGVVHGGVGHGGDELGHTVFVTLGGLDESQIRALWRAWFARRRLPVPRERLDAVLAPGSTLRQFARVPLVAAFCAWVAETDTVAATRAGLFAQVVNRFLARGWKSQDDAAAALFTVDDGARRRQFGAALAELAWTMAVRDGWAESVDVVVAEEVLRRRGPGPMPGHSLVFEAVRGCGVLAQAGVVRDALPGDGPVTWIHRSVQEYLVATHLRGVSDEELEEFVRRSWCRPADANVLDFALGSGDARVHAAVARHARRDDPLAFYTSLLAGAATASPVDRDQLRAAFDCGLVSAEMLVAGAAAADDAERSSLLQPIVRSLRQLGRPADTDPYRALVRCGSAGVEYVAALVARGADHAAAASELFDIDPARATRAVEERIDAGLDVSTVDRRCLRQLGAAALRQLLDAVLADPTSVSAARALGRTGSPLALGQLSAALNADDSRVRHAAAAGVTSWYGNALTPDAFEQLSRLAREDPEPSLRLAVRGGLYAASLSLPWVRRALEEQFEDLHADRSGAPLSSTADLAAGLWPVGTATHKVVVMLGEEPRLMSAALDEPLRRLEQRALLGGLDVPLTKDLIRLRGRDLLEAALDVLRPPSHLASDARDNLAVGVAFAAGADPEVFAALLQVQAEAPTLMLEAALTASSLGAAERVRLIVRAELALTAEDPRSVAAVRAWTPIMRRLLLACDQDDRDALRAEVSAATRHVLTLSRR